MKLYNPDCPASVTIGGKTYAKGHDNTYDVPDDQVRLFKQQGFVCAGRYLMDKAKKAEAEAKEPITPPATATKIPVTTEAKTSINNA